MCQHLSEKKRELTVKVQEEVVWGGDTGEGVEWCPHKGVVSISRFRIYTIGDLDIHILCQQLSEKKRELTVN